MSMTVIRGLGDFIGEKIKEEIAVRTGPFTFKPGEKLFHGTTNLPLSDTTGRPVETGDKFTAGVDVFGVPKTQINVAWNFGRGDGLSYKRLYAEREQNPSGAVLGLESDFYCKTLIGGLPYFPRGRTVRVVSKDTDIPMDPMEKRRDSARRTQFNQF